MSFTDNFDTGPSPLGTRYGWSRLRGAADNATILDGKVDRRAGTDALFYATGDDGATAQFVKADLASAQVGIALLASAPGGVFSGYYIKPQTGFATCRLWRVNGDGTANQLASSSTVPDCIGLTASVSVVNGNPTFKVSRGGVDILTFTDSSASKLVSGQRGIYFLPNGGTSVGAVDNYEDNFTAGGTQTIFINEEPDGYVFEGYAGAAVINFTGTRASGQAIERRIELEDGTVISDWSTAGVTLPTATTWSWTNATTIPVRTDGKDYRLKLRDPTAPTQVTTQGNAWAVGLTIPINDQSLHEIMANYGKNPSNGAFNTTTDPVAANRCRVLYCTNKTGVSPQYAVARLNTADKYGSGFLALADEIGRRVAAGDIPNIPIQFVDITKDGQPINTWNDNATPTGWSWSLLQYLDFMLAASKRRISILIRPVVVWPDTPAALATQMNTLIGNYESRLTNQPAGYTFPVWIPAPPRASRTYASNKPVRSAAIYVGQQGGRFSLMHPPRLDLQAEKNGDGHQATGDPATVNNSAVAHRFGNRLMGWAMGRGVAALLQGYLGQPITVDRWGPAIIAREFTSAAKTALRVTFDRDVRLRNGATTGVPLFHVSTDNKATWTELTGVKTGARTFEFPHPTGGNWTGQTVWLDYCRDTPYSNATGENGGEENVDALLAKLVYDTSEAMGGVGMLARNSLNEEAVVQDAAAGGTYATIAKGATVTLTKAQVATLRVKSGTRTTGVSAEPIGLRWERKTGDTTGRPYDGINVPLTVA